MNPRSRCPTSLVGACLAALCAFSPAAAVAAKAAEDNIHKVKPLPLYAADNPTTSAEVGEVVEKMMHSGANVVVYMNTHGNPGTGAPWGAGVGTCPIVEWDAKFRAKPALKDMQKLLGAAKVTAKEAAGKDAELIAAIAKDLQAGHTVVLGWCYGAHWATAHAAEIRKAAGI